MSITLILFRLANAGDADATVSVPGVSGEKEKKAFRADAKKHQEFVAKESTNSS